MAATRPVATRCWAACAAWAALALIPVPIEAAPLIDFTTSPDGITYGYRVLGDEELFRASASKVPKFFVGRTEIVTYPPAGVVGEYITCIVVIVPKGLLWGQHSVKILDGGVGERKVTLEIHSPPFLYLDYSLIIYGEREIKWPNSYNYNQHFRRKHQVTPNSPMVPNDDSYEQKSDLISQREEKPRGKGEHEMLEYKGQEIINAKNIINPKQSGTGNQDNSQNKQDSSDHGKGTDKQDGSVRGKGNEKREGSDHDNEKRDGSDHGKDNENREGRDRGGSHNNDMPLDKSNGKERDEDETSEESGEIMIYDESYSKGDISPVNYQNGGRIYDRNKMYDDSDSGETECDGWYLLIRQRGRGLLFGPLGC